MYSMCAERIAAEGSTTLLWHALDRNGDALCARMAGGTAAWQPDGADERDEYCGDCMDAVARAFRHAAGGAGARSAVDVGDGAVERKTDPAPPSPECRTRGR